MSETFTKYYDLYLEAVAARSEIDAKAMRRNLIYYGEATPLDFSNPGKNIGKKPINQFRKMCYELIESQIDTSIPLPKVSSRYAEDSLLASNLGEFLALEADYITSEEVNDVAEREVRVQGTGVYHISWDENQGNVRHKGGINLQFIHLLDFYPQPGVHEAADLEYAFVHTTTTVRKVKQLYNKTVEPSAGTKNRVDLVICWYLNDNNEVSKLVWKRDTLEEIYLMDNYFARKQRVCAQCAEPWTPGAKKCTFCGHEKNKLLDQSTLELPEDLKIIDTTDENAVPKIYLPKGTPVDAYRITHLPFVIRKNVPNVEASLYGVSDIDLLEEAQDANNKVLNKIADNIMSGGTVITLPSNATIDNAAGSIKKIRLQDPRQKQLVGVFPIQATVQQDDIFQDRLYQIGRQGVGITDAYQGKRDPTAESGKAKEISAAQTAGRLESKYVAKTTAYAHIYRKMFEFLLAFSSERRRIIKPYATNEVEEVPFNKYSFLLKEGNTVFFNDDFVFSTNASYILSNKKESLWQTASQAFASGAFGNPQDPNVVLMYWEIMNRYNYPLASQVLQILQANTKRLPPEIEQALIANPQLLQQLVTMIQAQDLVNEAKNKKAVQEAAEAIDPSYVGLDGQSTVDDIEKEGKSNENKRAKS